MPGRRTQPLSIVAGEPYHHQFTLNDADGAPMVALAPTARAALSRGPDTVTLDHELLDADAAVVLFSLDADTTAGMARGLWRGGVEVGGSTWLTWNAIVSEDPTP